MNDEQLDDLVRALAVTRDDVDGLGVDAELADLKEAIMATPTLLDRPTPAPQPVASRTRTRWFTTVAAAAAAAIGLVVVQPFGGGGGDAWAAALVEAAESTPLLLLEADGWSVERADIHLGDEGEMTFASDDASVDLHWRDGDAFDEWVEGVAASASSSAATTVLGHDATTFLYAGTDGDRTTLFHDGDHTIEVRGVSADAAAHQSLLDSLVEVDVDTWLSAMPESVIAAADRPATVRTMLADVPVPDGFDVAALEDGPLRDRYQLGAEVAGGVACAWIERWIDAVESGDQPAAAAASDALATSHDWDVLQEMAAEGGYPDVLWGYAEGVSGDGTVIGGTELTIDESYRAALGCDAAA